MVAGRLAPGHRCVLCVRGGEHACALRIEMCRHRVTSTSTSTGVSPTAYSQEGHGASGDHRARKRLPFRIEVEVLLVLLRGLSCSPAVSPPFADEEAGDKHHEDEGCYTTDNTTGDGTG